MIHKLLLLAVLITLLPACQSNRAIIKDIDAIHKQEKKALSSTIKKHIPRHLRRLANSLHGVIKMHSIIWHLCF
ncbi:hypothetical protein [Pseudoalteromonas luteoviolacea]|uniref:Lipoprotein n=1 Tax=Pseudoalteromonas luteoviolacea H33 TaxID=1365251 RepID=A0A167E047_9GAMM|nr:hypothetical protein [Pseudoalteromonas luteoviolacea]KZN49823.1 hypothetical protein N476_18695 [Pseudoalteromonas luteoviolacea H33]KZN77847.1 hypothetical protein N477_01150 [Pseudoalteromonas luteoviolacea H33-S]MBQ4879448.1 hypothetical protein [Pseudoalteromonas luteoviolacea]MBQ4908508.1 hypothetical protein [Pseudoalteromonas luteoviolacea]